MQASEIVQRSKASKVDALKKALTEAVPLKQGSARTHIYLKDLIPSEKIHGDEWVAHLHVVTEPKASGYTYEPPFETSQEPNSAERDARKEKEYVHHMEEEAHHREDLLKPIELQHDLEMTHLGDEEFLILYLEAEYEADFLSIAPEFEFDSVHVLGSEVLMREAEIHAPDMELYEAAHDVQRSAPRSKLEELIPPSLLNALGIKTSPKYQREPE